jgi:quinol monooxygenase YgiN
MEIQNIEEFNREELKSEARLFHSKDQLKSANADGVATLNFRYWLCLISLGCVMTLLSIGCISAQKNREMVSVAKIEIDSAQLDTYLTFLKEEIEASLRIEAGVHTLYALSEKAHRTHITIFETYADSNAYRAHLQTPHFIKYKTGTMKIVTSLQLIEQVTIDRASKVKVPSAQDKNLIVRIADIQVDSVQLENYKVALKEGIETSVRLEPGVLTLYGVYEKNNPTHISVLEIYANEDAYKKHLQTPHFKKYKDYTKNMVKSLELIDTTPIILGAK